MAATAALQSSGRRKYTLILEKLTTNKVCEIECIPQDSRTIMEGVKKEKVAWVKKKKWPQGMALKIEPTKEGIIFKMLVDTSIRNF